MLGISYPIKTSKHLSHYPLPPLIEPDGHIGRFDIRSSLGADGMSEILAGYDTELERTVAIKALASRYVESDTSQPQKWRAILKKSEIPKFKPCMINRLNR